MSEVRLAVLGGGSLRCAPAIVATLAGYFGERPMQIRMFDADDERLDLFDLLGRVLFMANKTPHGLLATADPHEALEGASLVVVCLDENGARKHLKARGQDPGEDPIETVLPSLLQGLEPDADVLSLLPSSYALPLNRYWRLAWPEEIPEPKRVPAAMDALRLVNGEDNPFPVIQAHERSPLRQWIDDRRTAEPVTPA